LVTGNSACQNVSHLENKDRDAKAVAGVFKQIGFDVTLVLDQDREETAGALKSFSRAAADADIAAVYYAGHRREADAENNRLQTWTQYCGRSPAPSSYGWRSMPEQFDRGALLQT
jgi:uncharacterized caspase-like protein